MPLKLCPDNEQSAAFTRRAQRSGLSLRLDGRAIPMDSKTGRLQRALAEKLGIALAHLRQRDDALSQGPTNEVVAARSGPERDQRHLEGNTHLTDRFAVKLVAVEVLSDGHEKSLPAKALQDLTTDFFSGFAEFDPEIDRLRPVNRAEPAVFATVTPPQFERLPLSAVVPPRTPRSTPMPTPPRKPQPGWENVAPVGAGRL